MRKGKETSRKSRHQHVRKRVVGSQERPRLNVYRSINHIYAQLIDDYSGRTIAAASSLDKELKGSIKGGGNVDAANSVGLLVAERAVDKGVKDVVFDRGGYLYHGRVKALADAAREGGLQF